MKKPCFILASASPRRAEILRALGIKFVTIKTETDETVLDGESPISHVRRLAREKATSGFKILPTHSKLFIGADTIVLRGKQILGKPSTPQDAIKMLQLLSGKSHRVLTGVALLDGSTARMASGVEATQVIFRKLSQEEITEYVLTGEPMDKAGGGRQPRRTTLTW